MRAGEETRSALWRRLDGVAATLLEDAGHRSPSQRYELGEELAQGGQAMIQRVWDRNLRRFLAMKVVRHAEATGGRSPSPEAARTRVRILEEALVTAQLDHPGIVPVHELGLDSQARVFFTMKLVKGHTLREVFERVREGHDGWTQVRALNVLRRVCEAMAYAHDKGVIHRDLKPSNVMVGRFGEVYVMDWGLARVLGGTDHGCDGPRLAEGSCDIRAGQWRESDPRLVTGEGDVLGTPAYMSPEQALGHLGELGPPSDVYSVGAILYHLLAGHPPYLKPGTDPSYRSTLMRVQAGPPDPLHQRAPLASPELAAICARAMARKPEQRYRDMAAMAADLSAFLERRVVAALETGAWAELRKWVVRNRGLAGAVGSFFLALAAGLTTSLGLMKRSEQNAALARQRGEKLLLANADLALANERLNRRHLEAEANLELAEQRRDEADASRLVAEERRDELVRLSALQDVADLLREADGLWPPHPVRIDSYRSWIARARSLVDGLHLHRAERHALRARALPRSEGERDTERKRHPAHAELVKVEGSLACLKRALHARLSGEFEPLPTMDWTRHPHEANWFRIHAADLTWPDPWVEGKPMQGLLYRQLYGQEPTGLAFALHGLELAEPAERWRHLLVVAWAYHSLGRDDDALATLQEALKAVPQTGQASMEEHQERLLKETEAANSAEGLARVRAEIEQLEQRHAELEARVDERIEWRFPANEPEARWWHVQLSKLIEELEELEEPRTGLLSADGIGPSGWSVPKRLAFAEQLREGEAAGGEIALAWERARAAIRERYAGLELEVQQGLVPLGPDPASGLWEFALLQTGEPPRRDEHGKLLLTEQSALVLVLLPGGTYRMGAQRLDPGQPNYDPEAHPNESPVHEVTIDPFFLSKYEMTQGQWLRLTGRNPSAYNSQVWFPQFNRSGRWGDLLLPVEEVGWRECVAVCARLGLVLPTEAQWEYAARAATDTPWWSGNTASDLAGVGNLADAYAKAHTSQPGWTYEAWDDGFGVHSPIAVFPPNPFGLHDAIGNVWEWCLDDFDDFFYARSPKDNPLNPARADLPRVVRGGSFNTPASGVRSSRRTGQRPDDPDDTLGLRPARPIL